MSEQAERQAQRLCVGLQNGRKKDRHSARARDERGVSIWTELRMRAGVCAEAEFVTERVNLCYQFKRNDSYAVIYGRNVSWTGKGSLRDIFYVRRCDERCSSS